nr:hypothetical protein [uncultured Flavobacterium sp.]
MKKVFLSLAVVAVLSVVSCKKADAPAEGDAVAADTTAVVADTTAVVADTTTVVADTTATAAPAAEPAK